MNVLVTGSAGFIGRTVVRALKAAGHRVTGIDRLPAPDGEQAVLHDLLAPLDTVDHLAPIDTCIHLAGEVGGFLFNVGRAEIPAIDARINENLAALCNRLACRHLVFFSSINVFETSPTFAHERLPRLDQRSHYAVSKALGEAFFAERFETLTVLRPTNVFGREQSRADAEVGRSHVIPELLARIDDGPEDSPLEVLGDGSQLRNFVHVSDIAAFLARNLEGRGRRWLNLRSDCTLSIGRLADELCRIRGRRRPLRYRPEFQHHELFTIKNFDLAPPAAAGWTPRIHDISRGLAV